MVSEKAYIVPFSSLSTGYHEFNYEIGKSFFDLFESGEIKCGSVKIALDFEKTDTMLILQFDLNGQVEAECGRCLDKMHADVIGKYRQVIKFSDEITTGLNDEITILPTSTYELDVSEYIYDFIHLSLPLKLVHENGLCNSTMTSKLDEYLITEISNQKEKSNETDNFDPRWAALKALRKED